jgi:hypothetical protein
MRNLTADIKKAISVDTLWCVDDFYQALEHLKNAGFQVCHWENEEQWASLSGNDRSVGYIWRRYPLLFITDDYADKIKKSLPEFDYIVWIIVNSLESEEFTIDMDQQLTARIASWMNTNAFSACDFWFCNA